MSALTTRFAPSPTGFLHLGHAASAFAVWDTAARIGASVRLRIEDIDQTRCRPEYSAAIEQDLRWLGLVWQGPVRHQSGHFRDYAAVLSALETRGLIYRCFKTRREIAALADGSDPDGGPRYSGAALTAKDEADRLDRGESFAWRLSHTAARSALGQRYDALHYVEETPANAVKQTVDPAVFGDVILARKDTPASYHLACCHDDALQGITHIIRGEDLRAVTAIHVLLQALMDWPSPRYRFHPLLLGPDGRKLAKRAGDKSLREYRNEGMTPVDIRSMTRAND